MEAVNVRIGLIDIDGKMPNIALMKLSAYYKSKGYEVERTTPIMAGTYDKVFASKIFTWSAMPALPENAVIGGTGYDLSIELFPEIDMLCPDYSLYPELNYSVGFLTRGCNRQCPWCFVPAKEGNIRPYMDIEEFAKHRDVVLLDNNVLACEHGLRQLEKIGKYGFRIDFNQGLDARLIDDSVARLLAKIKWLKPVRLACDTVSVVPVVRKAIETLRWHNVHPSRYFVYMLVTEDINSALERAKFLKGMNVDPFAQPYRPPDGEEPGDIQKDFSRWVNHKAIFNSVEWENYKPKQSLA